MLILLLICRIRQLQLERYVEVLGSGQREAAHTRGKLPVIYIIVEPAGKKTHLGNYSTIIEYTSTHFNMGYRIASD